MTRACLDALLAQIRAQRAQVITELAMLTEADFATPTSHARWDDIRRVLLRFGDHMREHANQVAQSRQACGHVPTMPQRMLAEAEIAWGKLLAATVGMTDEDLVAVPPEGGWSVEQVLAHILASEQNYLRLIQAAQETSPAQEG